MTVELACDLSALSEDERVRHAALLATWTGAALERKAIEDGYEFCLPAEPDLLAAIAEFIGLERRCCPFFAFELRIGAASEAAPEILFRLTGPPGASEVLATL